MRFEATLEGSRVFDLGATTLRAHACGSNPRAGGVAPEQLLARVGTGLRRWHLLCVSHASPRGFGRFAPEELSLSLDAQPVAAAPARLASRPEPPAVCVAGYAPGGARARPEGLPICGSNLPETGR